MAVLILVDDRVSPVQVDALRQAIGLSEPNETPIVQVTLGRSLARWHSQDLLLPLTLELSPSVDRAVGPIYSACRDLARLRDRWANWQPQIAPANIVDQTLWLPLVHTAKGTLYAEAIAERGGSYVQPLHLSDRQRQPLYGLGQQLLRSLAAPPAVYLLQLQLQAGQAQFDRLLPFPAHPAIASLGVQSPNLFACHWRCVTRQPLLDVAIAGSAAFQLLG